jgi:hypothetical protein
MYIVKSLLKCGIDTLILSKSCVIYACGNRFSDMLTFANKETAE